MHDVVFTVVLTLEGCIVTSNKTCFSALGDEIRVAFQIKHMEYSDLLKKGVKHETNTV